MGLEFGGLGFRVQGFSGFEGLCQNSQGFFGASGAFRGFMGCRFYHLPGGFNPP